MSYEIVKNLRVRKGDNGYVADVVSASSNEFPKYYNKWTLGKNEGYSRGELEKRILLDYLHGEFQKGKNKYLDVANLARYFGYLKKYDRIYTLYNKALKYASTSRNKKHFLNRAEALRQAFYKEGREALYKALMDGASSIKFIIKDKNTGKYVTKINRTTFVRGYSPKVFDSTSIFREVTENDFWRENFMVEIVK